MYVPGWGSLEGSSFDELLDYLDKLLANELISLNLFWFLIGYLIYYFLDDIIRSRRFRVRMHIVPVCVAIGNQIYTAIIDKNDRLGIALMMLYHTEYRGTFVREITNSWLGGRPWRAIIDPDTVNDRLYDTPAAYLQNNPEDQYTLTCIRPRTRVWRNLNSRGVLIETGERHFIREVVYTRSMFIYLSTDASKYFTRSYLV